MTVNESYEIEEKAYAKITRIKEDRKIENEAFAEGLEKGFDLAFRAMRDAIREKEKEETA